MTMQDQRLEELETHLLGQTGAEPPMLTRRYDEDDDAVTRLLDDALEQDEWWVAVSPDERRAMSTESLSAALWSGQLKNDVWVWRAGMPGWAPVAQVPQFALIAALPPAPVPAPLQHALEEPALEELPEGRMRGVVMGLSATAIVALFTTMYAISAGAGSALP